MSKKYRSYTDEFKREAVRLVETSGKSMTAIAADLGIQKSLLSTWRKNYHRAEDGEAESTEAEIRRLRKALAIAEEERDILKKAVSIFSRQQP
jgi:transposase